MSALSTISTTDGGEFSKYVPSMERPMDPFNRASSARKSAQPEIKSGDNNHKDVKKANRLNISPNSS